MRALFHAIALYITLSHNVSLSSAIAADPAFTVEEQKDRLIISLGKQPVAEFVFHDDQILRPYFCQVKTPAGLPVTRNHLPVPKMDAEDHATMHPGIWLAFGDISGHDFWRNKGRIEHVRFSEAPIAKNDRLTFATESKLFSPDGKPVCALDSRFQLVTQTGGWLLIWDATFRADAGEFTFGDQEEMGFGARVATPLTEKATGRIGNSRDQKTASKTWGQPAEWCDYSGVSQDKKCGVTLMAAPANFRPSWWHNRDYGVFVANPFGRAAMKQGDKSTVTVKQGETLRLQFGARIHEGADYDPVEAYREFTDLTR